MIYRPTKAAFLLHKKEAGHKGGNPLRDVILGGQDGLVNALGIILGASAATSDVKIIIATVLAASIAESISMGAVAYTSAMSQKDYYESERDKENQEIEKSPEMEKEEIRRIYERKGLTGEALEKVVDAITSDKKLWVDFMMSEELHIEPLNLKEILKSSIIVTIATAIGHLIPVLPFFFIAHQPGLITALVVSTIALFAVGAYQAITFVGSWWKNGLRMILIGMGAALAGYIIASLVNAAI